MSGAPAAGPAGSFFPRGPVVAVDLDQTLIFSVRNGGVTDVPLVIAEVTGDQASSFMTARSRDLLEEITSVAELVAVTTRTVEQVSRVRLPSSVRHVLCANGGILLNDGARDEAHAAWVRDQLAASAPLSDAWELLRRADGQEWLVTQKTADDLFCYQVLERAGAAPQSWDDELEAWASASNYSLSRQGRKVYLVPAGLTKGAALERLCSSAATPVPLLAAGDSLLDAEMLSMAQFSVRPPHGELELFPELVPGTEVVASTGFLAGEQILEALLENATRLAGTGTAR